LADIGLCRVSDGSRCFTSAPRRQFLPFSFVVYWRNPLAGWHLKGRLAEADAAVRQIEESVIASGKSLLPPSVTLVADSQASSSGQWYEVLQGIYLRRTLVVWCLWFSVAIVNYGLISWLPTLYRTAFHLPLSKALGYGLITQAIGFAGSISCALLIDFIGRRLWFILAFLGAGLSLLALRPVGPTSAKTVFICASTGFFFIANLSLLVYLYTSELYPTRIRAFGCGVGSAWLRLAATIGPLIVGSVLPGHGVRPVFAIFAAFSLFGAMVTMLRVSKRRAACLKSYHRNAQPC